MQQYLQEYGLIVETGRTKNVNKNPVAEKAIGELESELRKMKPGGEPISTSDLVKAFRIMNMKYRNRGLSASEILFRRDQNEGAHLRFRDEDLAAQQYSNRVRNHSPSAKAKAPRGRPASRAKVIVGDRIFVKTDGDKHRARDEYMIVSCGDQFVQARKLGRTGGFQSKIYDLKYSEIYPATPNHRDDSPIPLREYPDSSDSETDVLRSRPRFVEHFDDPLMLNILMIP